MEPTFRCADVALVRVPLGVRQAEEVAPDADAVPAFDDEWWENRFRRLAEDEALVEAVEHASPSLARVVSKVLRGEPVKSKVLRRATLALTKYHLRRNGRPTPFGLFAGVALARIGDHPSVRFGTEHRSVSRPDAGWLDTVLEPLRTDADVLANAVVVANAVHLVRDGRLVLPERYDERGERRLDTSVRFTPLVREVLRAAAEPIRWSRLLDQLRARFAVDQGTALEPVLRQLVAARFLITDTEPPPDCTDPLGHLLADRRRAAHPLFEELREVRRGLNEFDGSPAGQRQPIMSAVWKRMRSLCEAENLVQTDVRLDLDLTLPAELAREAERAAHTLALLGVAEGPRWLPGYHERFLERYGTERVVPVLELLDGDRGLGLPPEYLGQDLGPRGRPDDRPDRDLFLGELVMDHLKQGGDEILLSDADLERLSAAPEEARYPVSAELCTEVVAESWQDLCAGDFRLIVAEYFASPSAGATVSRFAHLFPAEQDALRRLATAAVSTHGAVAAQVAFRPRAPRSANVASIPQWLPVRIPLGHGPAARGTEDVRLRDLAVGGTVERLYLVDTATGDHVVPVLCSMVNPRTGHVPPTARFLLELGEQTLPRCQPWQWGSWANAPYRPRIRHGRTVLASASWLPSRAMVDAVRSPDDWRRQVHAWRERSGVARQVRLTTADNRVPVDLDDPLHVEVFRQELRKNPRLYLQEVPRQSGAGWLRGPRGGHANEVVFQLLGNRPSPEKPAQPVAAVRRTADLVHLPGGEWLYVKLYAKDDSVERMVREHLGRLLGEERAAGSAVDRWFFVRYADPDAHLRLRFHGKTEFLWSALLSRLHDWASGLREAGLLNRFELGSYEPEVERYGGEDLLTEAEQVFHADSELALALTPLPRSSDTAESIAALSALALLIRFAGVPELIGWLEAVLPVDERREISWDRREALAELITPDGLVRAEGSLFGQSQVRSTWERRDEVVREYAAALSRSGCGSVERHRIGMSLAHMHCNRLFGPDRAAERAVYALLHGALGLRVDRDRHGR
ncbi:lantibiotic dehydratase [Amycolatopsis anabasis]|uniref:lantibiotic dehydratase n=1 Tax=Amycolatopsis anabasis TaxID=1840409 RepID=UPI00131D5FA6|nr:lantibiotic dehydratase [Amycolatopsis anabasis]